MTTKYFPLKVACAVVFIAFAIVGTVHAQSEALASVQFPIAELGNCGSKGECKAYCDDSANTEACISYAERNNLMPAEEIQIAKKFIAAGAKGPGGCTGKDSCESYCNDINNMDVCIAFAEEAGMMPPAELAEAKKIQAAIRSGVKMPACSSKKECDAYCESPDNMAECITFAKAAGLMSAEEQANADMMLTAIRNGAKPPACRGKEECDAYCSKDENFAECVEFGRAAGFMTDEEYEMAKKTGGKGPGGCRGKDECDAFCTQPENEQTCFTFAEEHDLISDERRQQMQDDRQKVKESFSNMPDEVASCLAEKLGTETVEKIKSGEQRITRAIGESLPACFDAFQKTLDRPGFQGPIQPGSEGSMPDGSQADFGPPPGSENMGPPPGFVCEGDSCRPPEGMQYPGPYQGPEGQYPGPYQEGMPYQQGPTEGGTHEQGAPGDVYQQTASPDGGTQTVTVPTTEGEIQIVQPADTTAPAVEIAPASEPSVAVPSESVAGAVILFLKAFGF